MTTVIDRLRVQGGAAPGNPSNFVRSHPSRLSTRRVPTKKGNNDMTEHGRIHIGSTPMVRRLDLASAYTDASNGFSAMEFPSVHHQDLDSASKVSFVLSGKGVRDSHGVRSATAGCRLNRAGSYKITPREQYRVSHGLSLKNGSEPLPFGHGIHACYDPELDEFSHASLRTAKSTRSQADMNDHRSAPSISSNFGMAPPSTAATSNHPRAFTSLELTGQRFLSHATDDFNFYDSHILEDSCFPYLKSPRRSFRFPRASSQLFSEDTLSQLQDLQGCLKINKTFVPGSSKKDSHQTALKTNEENNVQGKTKYDAIKKDLRRYEFTNVGSYLRFNRQPQEQANVTSKPRLAHIPRGVLTLPEPWAESVLMKLVTDLRPPRSRMSSAQYSDTANQDELDEFFVIGSPTSLDKHNNIFGSQKSSGMLRKSQRNIKSTIANKTEEKIVEEEVATLSAAGFNTDGQDTVRSDSSVDPNDLEHQKEISETVQQDITVSVTVSKAVSKDNVENSESIDKESDLWKEEKIIVPVETSLCGQNDSFSKVIDEENSNIDS